MNLAAHLGVQYGYISGDWNPHHLWPWSARLLGYRKPIAHGMWTMAKALSLLQTKGLWWSHSQLKYTMILVNKARGHQDRDGGVPLNYYMVTT